MGHWVMSHIDLIWDIHEGWVKIQMEYETYKPTLQHEWIHGAMVARLTPDQKVACSIHVGFNIFILLNNDFYDEKKVLEKMMCVA